MQAFERVKRWRDEWLNGHEKAHWGDKIEWSSAEEIARRLDEPTSLDSAPRDGSLFDVQIDGVPYLDCRFDSTGALFQRHGYPAVTRIFNLAGERSVSWTPRPADRIQPYAENASGRKYIP